MHLRCKRKGRRRTGKPEFPFTKNSAYQQAPRLAQTGERLEREMEGGVARLTTEMVQVKLGE